MADKWTVVDDEGNALTKKSEGYWSAFHDGYAVATLAGEYNYIDPKGEVLSETNFTEADSFLDGLAKVKTADGYNYITTDGALLSETSYQRLGDFINGAARAQNTDGTWTLLREDGTTVGNFAAITIPFNGFANALQDGKWYAVKVEDGTVIGDGFREIGIFSGTDGIAAVRVDEETTDEEGNDTSTPAFSYIITDGTRLTEETFTAASDFTGGYAHVTKTDGLQYILKGDGTYMTNTGYPFVDDVIGGLARVRTGKQAWNILKDDGTFLLDTDVQRLCAPSCGFYRCVAADGVYNYILPDGAYLSATGFEDARDFTFTVENGEAVPYAQVKADGTWYVINATGEVVDELEEESSEEEA